MANSPGTAPDPTATDPAPPDPAVPSGAMLRRGLRLIGTLVALHPWPFTIGVAGATVYALATVGQAWVLGRVIDRVVTPAFERGDVATGTVVAGMLALIAVGVVKTVGVVTRRVGAGYAGTSIEATLRERLASQYHRLPLRYHREHAAGDLLSRAEGDLVATTHVIHPLPFGTGVLTMVVATTVWLIATDPFLAMVGLTVLPIVLGLNLVYQRLVERPVALGQRRLGEVSAVAHESFDGALVVKALHAEEAEGARFERSARLLRDARLHAARIQAGFEASLDGVPALGAIALLVVGAWRVQQGAVTAGTVVALVNLFVLLIWPLRVIGFVLSEIPRAVAGYDRVAAVLKAPHASDPADLDGNGELGDQRLPARSLDLEVEHLCFSYEPGVEVLHDVTFRVPAGCTVALVGPTGGGKTTLALLLAGLLEPDKGSIRLGGYPLAGLPRGEVSGAVALAFQEPFLFSTSIAENIRLTGGGSRDAMADAARLAQVEEFVRRLPQGYDTVVGERGATLSGGQRQRVALARALARRPRLLVLDDATASLDPVTEQKILTGLARHLPVMTTVVVASRLATIALADRVIYLEGGCVAGHGSHGELLAGVPGYAALVRAYEEQSA